MPIKFNENSITLSCELSELSPSLYNYMCGFPYDIVDVNVTYDNKFITTVDPEQRDNKGNYKAERKTVKVPRKVICTFADGRKQFALCSEEDEFNLEVGITICLCKQLLTSGVEDGTKKYNSIVRDGLKIYKGHLRKEKEIQDAEEARKIREASKQRRRLRKAEKKKEREIEILAEAIRRSRISE